MDTALPPPPPVGFKDVQLTIVPPSPPPVSVLGRQAGNPPPSCRHEDLTYFRINSATATLTPFENEVTKTTLQSSARLKHVSYGKVVSMSYLTKKLALFLLSASLQVLDVLSDVYFCHSLYTQPSYDDLPESLKTRVLVFLLLSTALWLAISFIIAFNFKDAIGYNDHSASAMSKPLLLLSLMSLVAFDCPLFLISLPQRTVKVSDITVDDKKRLSNSVFVLGFESRGEWKASTHYGLISHLPTFVFEDIPLFILNIQISMYINECEFRTSLFRTSLFRTSLTLSIYAVISYNSYVRYSSTNPLFFSPQSPLSASSPYCSASSGSSRRGSCSSRGARRERATRSRTT